MEKIRGNSSKGISTRNNSFATNKIGTTGITLIALVITIVLNYSYLAMERIIDKEPKNLKIY